MNARSMWDRYKAWLCDAPELGFRLLSHADPRVGVDDICPMNGILGRRRHAAGNAWLHFVLSSPVEHLRPWLVARRRRDDHPYPEEGGAKNERSGHVIAVADESKT